MLAGNAKQLAARHEQLEIRAGCKQFGEPAGGDDDVLEVVEQQEK